MTELLLSEKVRKDGIGLDFTAMLQSTQLTRPPLGAWTMDVICSLAKKTEMKWKIAGKCISKPLINITVWNNNMLCKYRTNMFAQPEVTCLYNIPDVMLSTAAPTSYRRIKPVSSVYIWIQRSMLFGREWQGGISSRSPRLNFTCK